MLKLWPCIPQYVFPPALITLSSRAHIYLTPKTQVHILPILLTRPSHLLRPHRLLTLLSGILRSSTFLSTFVSTIWLSVCFTRTLFVARLLGPYVSHDWWDGPYGCVMVGSLICGGSIWIENGRRRGEMALYVLPRAVRACLSSAWLRGGRSVKVVERYASLNPSCPLILDSPATSSRA